MKSELHLTLDRIEAVTAKDMQNKTISDLFLDATSELGELATEIAIEEQTYGNAHKEVDEGSKAEAVDLLISSFALFYARGGSVEEFVVIAHKKLDKWQDNQQKSGG